MDYQKFLESKIKLDTRMGFDVPVDKIDSRLFPHQRDIAKWAIRGGRRAIFASFGLGKTFIQLEIMRQIQAKEGGRQLIIMPLGVRQEFKQDAAKLGIEIVFVRWTKDLAGNGLYITNYESIRDGRLDPNQFNAVSLDEASVLRSYGSKTFQEFLTLFEQVKYRFVATATPSPNRFKELIHYAGFLGIMDTGQALAQPLASKVLTPGGWVKMGDVLKGDYVIGRQGKPTKVLGVYPQGEKSIYRVTFSDGSSTRCTEDHLWLTSTQYQRNASSKFRLRNPEKSADHYWTVKSTAEVMDTLRCEPTGSKNHMVPMVMPVQFTKQSVPMDQEAVCPSRRQRRQGRLNARLLQPGCRAGFRIRPTRRV
jgi:hypothetical protein